MEYYSNIEYWNKNTSNFASFYNNGDPKNKNINQICIGEVAEIISLDECRLENISPNHDIKSIHPKYYRKHRDILFILTKDNKAIDLINKNEEYPLLVEENKISITHELGVIKAYSLGPLLKFYEYPEWICNEEIKKIYDKFFTGRFGYDNYWLFGMEKTEDKSLTKTYIKGSTIANDEIRKYEFYQKNIELGFSRLFKKGPLEGIASSGLMKSLDSKKIFEPIIMKSYVRKKQLKK